MKNYLTKPFIVLITFIIFLCGCSNNESKEVFKNQYDWESYQFTSGPFLFELPENWKEFTEMGTRQAMFFTDKDADLNERPSNVVVEIPENLFGVESDIDYSNKEIQKEFLKFLEEMTYTNIPDLTNYQSKMVENPRIFIVEYDRMADENTAVHQTCYYLTDKDYYSAIVYATDFKDEMSPNINEVAMRIIQTWNFDTEAIANGNK